MGPIVKEVAAANADKSIKFVQFDFTSNESKAAGKKIAAELGVAGLYAENAPNTGFALIYDTKKQAVVGKLTPGDDAAKWQSTIDGAIGG